MMHCWERDENLPKNEIAILPSVAYFEKGVLAYHENYWKLIFPKRFSMEYYLDNLSEGQRDDNCWRLKNLSGIVKTTQVKLERFHAERTN